jgi:hypothetical protein
MDLLTAIKKIQYDNSFEIWAERPFRPDSPARFGRDIFECGGMNDGKSRFADGVEIGDYIRRYLDNDQDLLGDADWIIEAAEAMIEEREGELPSPPGRALAGLAEELGMPYDTLAKAAREGRLWAWKDGGIWLSLGRFVEQAMKDGGLKENESARETLDRLYQEASRENQRFNE